MVLAGMKSCGLQLAKFDANFTPEEMGCADYHSGLSRFARPMTAIVFSRPSFTPNDIFRARPGMEQKNLLFLLLFKISEYNYIQLHYIQIRFIFITWQGA